MPKSIIKIVLLILSSSLCGCHPLFCVWNLNYVEIDHSTKINDIVGTYNLTAYSKKMMYYEGKYKKIPNSKLQLNADSTYIITNAPDWLIDVGGTSMQEYFTKKGKWFLYCDDKAGCSMELEGVKSGDLLNTKKNKMSILLTVGDPDSCQGMVYEKQ